MAGRQIDHAGMRDHFRMDVPVGDHQRAHQLDAVGELAPGPAWQPAIESPDAGWVRHDRVLALDPVFGAPGPELAHEAVRNLYRPRSPVARVGLVLPAKRLVELRHREPIQIHEAGRVVDDEADRDPRCRVEHHDVSCLDRALAGRLRRRAASQPEDAGGRRRLDAAEKVTPGHWRHHWFSSPRAGLHASRRAGRSRPTVDAIDVADPCLDAPGSSTPARGRRASRTRRGRATA